VLSHCCAAEQDAEGGDPPGRSGVRPAGGAAACAHGLATFGAVAEVVGTEEEEAGGAGADDGVARRK